MWSSLLLLLFLPGSSSTQCTCGGVEISSADQTHCWEVVEGWGSGWVDGDDACQKIGGHLGHPQDVYSDLVDYLKKVYTKPLLTGIVVGNVEMARYGIMCPNNVYHGLLQEEDYSSILGENATGVDSCAFITDADYKVHFAPCMTAADALCDRPMEKEDYCNMMMNCSETTTSSSRQTTSENKKTTVTVRTSSRAVMANTTTTPPTTPFSRMTTTSASTVKPVTAESPSEPASSDCTKQSCGSNEWRIFGMCIDWRLMLLLLALLLLLCCCCWLLHCCMHCCMWCRAARPAKNRTDPEAAEKPIPQPVLPVTLPKDTKPVVRYSPEPEVPIPPPATIASEPVIAPIGTKDQPTAKPGIGLYTREIRMMYPEKPTMKDAGMNTEPWVPNNRSPFVAKSKKKPIKQPIVPPVAPEIYDDVADDISIGFSRSPSPDRRSVQPEGDVPFVFVQNSKPDQPPPSQRKNPLTSPAPPETVEQTKTEPPTVISVIGNPRTIRSPPPREKSVVLGDRNNKNEPGSPPDFPVKDDRTAKPRFPSPPSKRATDLQKPITKQEQIGNSPNDHGTSDETQPKRAKPSLPSAPITNFSNSPPTAPKPINKPTFPSEMNSSDQRPIPSRDSEMSRSTPSLMKQPDVSMRAPRGKLGGAVRAGGGGSGETPTGWKPWAKSSAQQPPSPYLG